MAEPYPTMTYRDPDQRARIEDLERELARARAEVSVLKSERGVVARVSNFIGRVRWWERVMPVVATMTIVSIVVGGFTYVMSLPPHPKHKYVRAADGEVALENQCDVRTDCEAEAENECGGEYIKVAFDEKYWVETVCTQICSGDGKTMTCFPNCWPEKRYTAWVTYRCPPRKP